MLTSRNFSPDYSLIFDIDGTLIDSFRIAGEEYQRAILTILPEAILKPQWKEYENVTDSGIILEVLSDNRCSSDPSETIKKIEEVFMQNITERLNEVPCQEILGAQNFLHKCRKKYQKVGIATGCWKDSGRVKLETAGYQLEGIPMASSSDHHTREGILLKALERLKGNLEHVVYFGDAEWDLKTTGNLGWNFIGIGEKLEGVCPNWFPDFSDHDGILKVVEQF